MSTMIIETADWVTAQQAAALAGVTEGRIRQLARDGDIERMVLSSRMVWYSRKSVLKWASRPRPKATGGRPRTSDR